MKFNRILAASAIAALMAGAAAAQTAAPDTGMSDQSGADQSSASAANQSGAPASASMSGPVTSSPTAADQAYTLKAGDPNVVSNAPVADTPANRQQYGGPMSNAGRHTKASGD